VDKLYAGERIPAFPGVSQLTMSYKDHLRLFLLCQRGGNQRQAFQRVVSVNLWHWAGGSSGSSGRSVRFDDYTLDRYASEVRAAVDTELRLWPFGSVRIRREGVMGYDRPFALLPSQ